MPQDTALTVGDLVRLEHAGDGARQAIDAMSDEQLAELSERVDQVLDQLRESRIQGVNLEDLTMVATRARCTLRGRRAQASLDALMRWTPR